MALKKKVRSTEMFVLTMKKYADEYLVNENSIIDLQNKSNHPIPYLYSEIFDSCLLKAKLKDGRIPPFFKITDSPFYIASAQAIENNNYFNTYKCKYSLESFYQNFQPKNIVDWYQLKKVKNNKLKCMPPWSAVLPWRARSLESYGAAIINASEKEINQNINNKKNVPGIYWNKCGPVTKEVVDNEVNRLEAVFYSISKNGYIRNNSNDGDITANALVDEKNEWRWLVTGGYHRLCIYATLGCNEVTIRVNKVAIKTQSKFWPHVLDGLYTQKEALNIFNNIFKGEKSGNDNER